MFIRPGDRKTVFSNIANVKCTEFYNLRIIAAVNKTPGLSIIYRNDSIQCPERLLTFGTSREGDYSRQGAYSGQGAFFFEK